jgi:hypothetical protein
MNARSNSQSPCNPAAPPRVSRSLSTLLLGATLALAGVNSSTAADSEAKANAILFNNLSIAAKTAPKVTRITYTATLLSGKMRLALVSDGVNAVCFVTDGNPAKPMSISLEGNVEKETLFMSSNLLGHERSGSRATFTGSITSTAFGGTLTMDGVKYAVSGRAVAAKSPAGLYHQYASGVDVMVAVDESGAATAIAKRVRTGEVFLAKVATPVAPGTLPRTTVYGPTGKVVLLVDVRRVRTPLLGLLQSWSDGFQAAAKPVAVSIGNADLFGNAIRPYDIAVVQNPADSPLPAAFLYSEYVESRIVLNFPIFNPDDGNQLTLANSSSWGGGRPGHLAAFENAIALESLTNPAFVPGTINEIPRAGQITKFNLLDGGTSLQREWFFAENNVGNLVKNAGGPGFLWTRRPVWTVVGDRRSLTPRALILTSATGVHTVLSNTLADLSSGNDTESNAIGQLGAQPSCLIPFRYENSPISMAHHVTNISGTSTVQNYRTLQDFLGNSLVPDVSPNTFMRLDGMDLTGFQVVDGARMGNDAIFLLTKHRNYWKQEGQTVSGGPTPSYREVGFGPLIFEEADRWALSQFSAEPSMWALVRIDSFGRASVYHKGTEPLFATGIDVESTPEGDHVLLADNGNPYNGGQVIRIAPSQEALDAYHQRLQDAQQ